jgi:hypothetical protein
MGRNTKIICTIVPNPYKSTDKEFHFSLFVTPRLPDSGILKEYYEIQHWNEFYDFFLKCPFELGVAKLMPKEDLTGYDLTSGENVTSEHLTNVTRENLIERNFPDECIHTDYLWESLFKEDTPVKGWILNEGEISNKITDLIDRKEYEKARKHFEHREVDGISSLTLEQRRAGASASHAAAKSVYDIERKKMSVDEIRFMNKENQEFHKKISIMADYPHLLKAMGWIIDFRIAEPAGQALKKGNAIKLIVPERLGILKALGPDNKWRNFLNELDFKCPWTYYNPADFSPEYSPSIGRDYFDVQKGFVSKTNETSFYTLKADQIDNIQVIAKMQELVARQKKESLETKNSDRVMESEKNETLASNGIGIKVSVGPGQKEFSMSPLATAVQASPETLNSRLEITINGRKNSAANIDDFIIFGHQLDNGYRIDVADCSSDNADLNLDKGKFNSLCARIADYGIDKSPYKDSKKVKINVRNFEDEPWVSESAQAGKSGLLYVDEELCRWNNWSLTCPHLGNYPQDETKEADDNEFNDIELQNIRPFTRDTNGELKGTLIPLRFGRKYKFRIRIVDICGNGPLPNSETPNPACIVEMTQPYQRFERINPPEIHFVTNIFEGNLFTKSSAGVKEFGERRIKRGYEGEDLSTLVVKTEFGNGVQPRTTECERSICPPRVNVQFAEVHGVLDLMKDRASIYSRAAYDNSNDEVEVFRAGHAIPFLTDPCVTTFRVIVEGAPREAPLKWASTGKGYLENEFQPLVARGTQGSERFGASEKGIVVNVKPGEILEGQVVSNEITNPAFLSTNPNIFQLASGLTTPKKISFIHAVQRPILTENAGGVLLETYNLAGDVASRTPTDGLTIRFSEITFDKFPFSTSGEFRIIARYTDRICDINDDSGFKGSDKEKVKLFSNLNADKTVRVPDNSNGEFLIGAMDGFPHSLEDTRYHQINYTLEAVSRFKDYFPREKKFSVEGIFKTAIIIKNSVKPPPLKIHSINPVLKWETKGHQVTRTHNSFRIYFEGPWNETGNGEAVAVIFHPNESSVDDSLEGLISEFGKDPTTENEATNGISENMLPGPPVTGVDSLLLGRSASGFNEPPVRSGASFSLDAAISPASFDSDKKKYFAEITLAVPPDKYWYFPFVKFALARYQEHSIRLDKKYDFRFSDILMAPQMQLLPTRKVDLKTNNFVLDDLLKSNYRAKKLEFYMIMEFNREKEFERVVGGTGKALAFRIDKFENDIIEFLDFRKRVDELAPDCIFLEEYEYHESGDDFTIGGENYNPRNDIRKRLVFTYQLK